MTKEIENAIWIAVMYGYMKGKDDSTVLDNMQAEEVINWVWNSATQFEKVYNELSEDYLSEIDDYATKVLHAAK